MGLFQKESISFHKQTQQNWKIASRENVSLSLPISSAEIQIRASTSLHLYSATE